MNVPDFTVPAPVAKLTGRLPQLPPTLLLTTLLNLSLDRVLPREPLQPLYGKRLQIRVRDAGLSLRFTMGRRHFHPSFDPRTADLTITARSRDFLALMLREEDADTLFFSRRLLMEGDTELGLLVKNTLDAVELPQLDATRLAPGQLWLQLQERLHTWKPSNRSLSSHA